jgi:hypothetical protein
VFFGFPVHHYLIDIVFTVVGVDKWDKWQNTSAGAGFVAVYGVDSPSTNPHSANA